MADKEKRDRIWLALCTAAGVAVDVTLNKYSSTLSGYAVAAIWALPAILFVIWFWRVEKTRDWVKNRFLEHPVSYVLMFLILIPFGWQATATMVSKLKPSAQKVATVTLPPAPAVGTVPATNNPKPTDERQVAILKELPKEQPKSPKVKAVPPTQGTTVGNDSVAMGKIAQGSKIGDRSVQIGATDSNGNTIVQPGAYGFDAHSGPGGTAVGEHSGGGVPAQPIYEQKCEGSACAQGPGSQATFNQYGAPKLVMTDAQRDAISENMKPFGGSKVRVGISLAEPDSGEYGRQLVLALQNAGMTVEHSEAWSIVQAGAPASGVSFSFTENHRAAAEALGMALRKAGSARAPIPASVYPITGQTPDGFFAILVQPNR